MKKLLLLLLCITCHRERCAAQGENNVWTFATGSGGNNAVLMFPASGAATLGSIPSPWDNFSYGAAVCSPSGQLRFFVRLNDYVSWAPPLNNIFTAAGTPVSGSNLKCSIADEGCMPVVVPHPGNSNQYYIFYAYGKGILYSLLDMSLNGGAGGIVPGQKDIVIAAYGTVLSQKMTAAKGCDGVWLVVRSRVHNEYYSYHITHAGIDLTQVVSHAGAFGIADYNLNSWGFLKASPSGDYLALSSYRGLELYKFEKCSGKVSDYLLLDTTGSPPYYAQHLNNNTRYQGVCFSPDNSKLYATRNSNITTGLQAGQLFQFDVGLNDPAAILASKTLVLTNHPSIVENLQVCNLEVPNPLGEIKAGPDGRLYVDNGSYTCLAPSYVPIGFNPGPAFHVIQQPNLGGLACTPLMNVVGINAYTGNLGGNFGNTGDRLTSQLQQDIITAPPALDTLSGNYNMIACFNNELSLKADTNGHCLQWDDGTTTAERIVHQDGVYWVQYFRDCNFKIDSYHVNFIHLPILVNTDGSCPGMGRGTLTAQVADTCTLNYVWQTADGSILRQCARHSGDTLSGLDPGNYLLTISSPQGCDTTLLATVEGLPSPSIVAAPEEATVRYGDAITLHASGALLYVWWPVTPLDTATKADPIARPLTPTVFNVIGISENGCRDTGYVKINIDYTIPQLVPNAFSPNGDGLNDVFRVEGVTYQKVIAFSIFNRYGQEIFHALEGNKGWDGTQNGRPCDAGTYYYRIELSFPDGTIQELKGDVLLIR